MTAASGAHRARVDLQRSSDRAAVLALVIAALLALLIWSPSIGGHAPGDPQAVAADARLERCGGTVADAEFAFIIPAVRTYPRYLPSMGRFSELESDRPALVVVYRGVFPRGGTDGPSGPTTRNVCVYVGPAGGGSINYFTDVSVAGLRATPDGPVLIPNPQT